MAQIKGFAVRGVLKFTKARHPGGIRTLLDGLSEASLASFERPIVSSRWYPYEVFSDLLETLERQLGGDNQELLRDVGIAAGTEDVGSIFKVILAIASMDTVVKRGGIFWQKYCDTGRLECRDNRPGFVHAALVDFPDMHPAHCNLINGWNEGIGQSCGAKGVASRHVRCISKGDPECIWEAVWEV